jgi:hypothetical protein
MKRFGQLWKDLKQSQTDYRLIQSMGRLKTLFSGPIELGGHDLGLLLIN